jgi:hypothetical protein
MDYQFIVFVILAIIFCTYPPMYFFKQNKNVAAFLTLVMFILIFTFYGLRWFSGAVMAGPAGAYSGNWPPYVNVCPDYLTYFEDATRKGCINRTSNPIGGLPKANITPTNAQIFNHYATGTGVSNTYDLKNKNRACMKAIEKGLTWEGITNGDSCTF